MKDVENKLKNLSYSELLDAYYLLQKRNDELKVTNEKLNITNNELNIVNKNLEQSNKKLLDEVKQLEIIKKLSQKN